ncbi:hypothetical protein RJD24_04700 [Bacillaceae bacterium IKA-2]|nr:hypothetical protein RJD24_04700 [Bacillaceae bacterium IKA-2]
MTKKMLQGLATGIFFTTSILSFAFYFTDYFQIGNEVATFSEQDLQAYLDENDLVTVNQTEYELLHKKVEKIDTETAESETNNQDAEEEIEEKEITIIIKVGMSSGAVGLLLEEKGLIDDNQQFAEYLLNNELETKIKAGEYQLSTEMTIKEIVEILS